MPRIKEYNKKLKGGLSKTLKLTGFGLENKVINKKKAKENIKLYEGKRPYSLDLFLKFIGLNENEFTEVIKEHVVSPNKFSSIRSENAKKPHDFDKWSKEGQADTDFSSRIFTSLSTGS